MDSSVTSVAQPVAQSFVFNTQEIFFLIWTITALTVILIPVFSTLRLHLQLRNANIYFIDHKDKNSIPIYQSEKVSVPFSTGILRPKIYVPAIWETWSTECRQMILKHEIAHIKRGDGFMRMIQSITHALYFFHPLIWVLNRKVHDYREMACDDSAVHQEKAVSIEYAKALVQIAENLVQSNIGCASASALIKQRNELLNRVKYQMEGSMKNLSKTKIGLIMGMIVLLIIPLSWSKSKTKQEPVNLGRIQGRVVDAETGKVLNGANIYLESTSIGTASDRDGNFTIQNIPVGKYDVTASSISFHKRTIKGIDVLANESIQINFLLNYDPAYKHPKDLPGNKSDKQPKTSEPTFKFLNSHSSKTSQSQTEKDIVFVPFDEPPQPAGGFPALQSNIQYPDLARRAGIEGRVTVYAQISEEGEVLRTKVVQSLGENGCDEAAVEAIKATKWMPAKQEDKPVTVWIAVPVEFRLSQPLQNNNTPIDTSNITIVIDENNISISTLKPSNSMFAFTGKQVELNNLKDELLMLIKQFDKPIIGIVPGKNANMNLVEKVGNIAAEVTGAKK